MAHIIAVANQKGGVGKTTTSVNVAAALAEFGRSVLLVDLDPQGNSTMGCGVNKDELSHTINDVLLGVATLTEALIEETAINTALLPSNRDLTEAEVQLLQLPEREFKLKKILEKIRDRYQFIIIDCPPTLNMLTVNALVAANSIIIPMQCEYYALEGLSGLIDTIEQLRATVNPILEVEGILRTMYDGRSKLTVEVSTQLEKHFHSKVFKTLIPRNIRLAEAPSHGASVFGYDPKSTGAIAYRALAQEVLQHYPEDTRASQVAIKDEVVGELAL